MPAFRLRTKIIFWVVVTLLVMQTMYFYIIYKDRSKQSLEMTEKASRQLSSIIKETLEYKMERKQCKDVQQTVEIIGNQKDVEHVMIIKKRGKVVFSSRKGDIGKILSIEEKSCQICHQQKPYPHDEIKVFTLGGERILRNVNPIRNSERCNACHDSQDKILGVLVVDTSLLPLDEELGTARNRMIFFTIIIFLSVSLILALLIYVLVDRPIGKLASVVSNAAEGRLDSRVDIVSRDELGKLSKGFNMMMDKVTHFNQELQERVKSAVEECRRFNVELMKVNRHLEKANRELQKSQEQIIQSEKMFAVGQLASGVAHEINNPLGSILTYIKLAIKKLDNYSSDSNILEISQLKKYMATVEGEVNRCKGITRSLLDFSRVREPEMNVVDINDILNNALELVEHQLSEQRINLVKKVGSSTSKIVADSHQIQQVFINIILNAIHAMSEGGILEITTRKRSKSAEIVFKDSGCGIVDEDLPRIFTPFFTTKKVGEGTGLGLSVAYGIIENHGGEIIVKSKTGEGTTVIIMLPVVFDKGNTGSGKGRGKAVGI
ncbi:MAG: HAMP domain-containing protein [Deltaproteobacteria bacterium]|nr:HAMP domain-containing protein [Deltaproteobacteria bacterium]